MAEPTNAADVADGASKVEICPEGSRRRVALPQPRLRNGFAALALRMGDDDDIAIGEVDEEVCQYVPARPHGLSQGSGSSRKTNKKKQKGQRAEKKDQGRRVGGGKDVMGVEVDATAQELPEVDDFVWCYVFQQVGNAAQLARLRLVCQRWRAVIDAEERLWRGLVERDFAWKQSETRTGKGARRRQTRHINYQLLYRNLAGVARKEKLKEEEQQRTQAKLSSFMCQVLPHVLELQIKKANADYLQSNAQSWLACTHPHARGYALECKDCNLGMMPKTYQPDEYWEKNWPKLLDYRLGQRKARQSMAHRFQSLYVVYNPG